MCLDYLPFSLRIRLWNVTRIHRTAYGTFTISRTENFFCYIMTSGVVTNFFIGVIALTTSIRVINMTIMDLNFFFIIVSRFLLYFVIIIRIVFT